MSIPPYSIARKAGKAAALAGNNPIHRMSAVHRLFKKPCGRHPILGVEVYKADTKGMARIAKHPLPNVPNVWYVPFDEVGWAIIMPKTACIAWFRRHKTCELEEATATLLMMGYELILLVRSFEPP